MTVIPLKVMTVQLTTVEGMISRLGWSPDVSSRLLRGCHNCDKITSIRWVCLRIETLICTSKSACWVQSMNARSSIWIALSLGVSRVALVKTNNQLFVNASTWQTLLNALRDIWHRGSSIELPHRRLPDAFWKIMSHFLLHTSEKIKRPTTRCGDAI